MGGPFTYADPTAIAAEAQSLSDVKPTSNPAIRRTSAVRPSSIPLGPIAQKAQADLIQSYAEYKTMLAEAGITEQEFEILVQYIRETSQVNKELKRHNKPEIRLGEMDLEQRILAARPQTPRFPGTLDTRGYNIGITPRTELAGEYIGTGVINFTEALVEYFWEHPGAELSLVLDFLPVIGELKAGIEAIYGRDLITGEEIPTWARALGATIAVIPAAKGIMKLTSLGGKLARRAGSMVRKLAPIAVVAALSYKAPAEAIRLMKNVAELDEAAMKLAKIEADAAKGVLHATELQEKATQEVSKLLTAQEAAELDRRAVRESATPRPDVPAPPAKKLPDAPEALPVGQRGKASATRKPKGKPKPKPRPKKPTVAAPAKPALPADAKVKNFQIAKTGSRYGKAYWNQQELRAAQYVMEKEGLFWWREAEIWLMKGEELIKTDRRLDAVLIDPITGEVQAAEWTTARQLSESAAKKAQLASQRQLFAQAKKGWTVLARPAGEGAFFDITKAAERTEVYPHWRKPPSP